MLFWRQHRRTKGSIYIDSKKKYETFVLNEYFLYHRTILMPKITCSGGNVILVTEGEPLYGSPFTIWPSFY